MLSGQQRQNSVFFESEFLNWAARKILELEKITIVSRTPIIFFMEETPSAKKYHRALEQRLERRDLFTTYLMSESELSKVFERDESLPGRIREMMRWRDRWTAGNVVARVIAQGHFPNASFWIGESNEEEKAFIKIGFEDAKNQPMWLNASGEIPGIKKLVRSLTEHSLSFAAYLELNSEALASLEP